jgi:hypothetical protein
MNERIKELMEEAGIYDFVIESMGINEEMEKFAELIVREMLDIFDKRAEPGTGFYEPQEPAEMIREHFGVEE